MFRSLKWKCRSVKWRVERWWFERKPGYTSTARVGEPIATDMTVVLARGEFTHTSFDESLTAALPIEWPRKGEARVTMGHHSFSSPRRRRLN